MPPLGISKNISKKKKPYIRCHRLRVDNKKKEISRIIAEENLGRLLMEGEVVHHIDGDTSNNNKENLRVMTRSEHAKLHNPRDYERFGVSAAEDKGTWNKLYQKEKYNRKPRNFKITDENYSKIKELLDQGEKQTVIAKRFNVHPSAVSRIKRNVRYNNFEKGGN